MTITLKRAGWAAAALLVGGLVVAWSGFVNVAASTGHWMITDLFLHWVMRNSVRTQAAITVDDPATDPRGLVSAAGHFAVNCAPCHGAPGERRSPVMQAATPPPPELARTVGTYSDRELFWVIKHGVKFTPMPAWPAQDRDDEVRRMAAFVQRLPRMSEADYRALAYGSGHIAGGETRIFDAALADCERCHAESGRGQSDIPVLVGQKSAYLLAAL
jgi:cytochrome c553